MLKLLSLFVIAQSNAFFVPTKKIFFHEAPCFLKWEKILLSSIVVCGRKLKDEISILEATFLPSDCDSRYAELYFAGCCLLSAADNLRGTDSALVDAGEALKRAALGHNANWEQVADELENVQVSLYALSKQYEGVNFIFADSMRAAADQFREASEINGCLSIAPYAAIPNYSAASYHFKVAASSMLNENASSHFLSSADAINRFIDVLENHGAQAATTQPVVIP